MTDVQFRDLLPYARRNEFRGPAAFTVRQVVPANAVQSTVARRYSMSRSRPDSVLSEPRYRQRVCHGGTEDGGRRAVPGPIRRHARRSHRGDERRGVDSIGIQLNFDTSVLTLSSFTLGSATSGWLPSFNVSGKKATLVKTGGAALTNTASEVLIVRFTVNAGLADGRSTAIEFVPGATSTVLKIGAATQTFTLLDGPCRS